MLTPTDKRALPWGHLAAFITAFIWAGSYSVVKVGLEEIPPLSFVAMRCTIAGVMMLALAKRTQGSVSIRREDIVRIGLLGAIGIGAGQGFWASGMHLTTASNTSVLVSLAPVFMLIYLNVLGRQRARARQWAGVIIAMAGTLLIVLGKGQQVSFGQASLRGDLLMLLVPMISAGYNIALGPMLVRYGAQRMAAYVFVFAALAVWPFALRDTLALQWNTLSLSGWVGLFYGIVLSLVVGYQLWYRAMEIIGVVRTVMYLYLQPVLGVMIAAVYLGERPTLALVVGCAVTLAGVAMVQMATPQAVSMPVQAEPVPAVVPGPTPPGAPTQG